MEAVAKAIPTTSTATNLMFFLLLLLLLSSSLFTCFAKVRFGKKWHARRLRRPLDVTQASAEPPIRREGHGAAVRLVGGGVQQPACALERQRAVLRTQAVGPQGKIGSPTKETCHKARRVVLTPWTWKGVPFLGLVSGQTKGTLSLWSPSRNKPTCHTQGTNKSTRGVRPPKSVKLGLGRGGGGVGGGF